MLTVSTLVGGWLGRPRAAARLCSARGRSGEHVTVWSARDGGRSGRDSWQPDGSGPSSGERALRLHLTLIPPGARGEWHPGDGDPATLYLLSGAAEVWHGDRLTTRALVSAGDVVYLPPRTPHRAVNRGDVTAIAVLARTGPAPAGGPA